MYSYDVIVKPRFKTYETEAEVRKAWNQNIDFTTPFERNACMNKLNWQTFGNRLNRVVYSHNGLEVVLMNSVDSK